MLEDEKGNPTPNNEEIDDTILDGIDDDIENEDGNTPEDEEIDPSKVDVKALIAQLKEQEKLLKTTSAQKEHFKNKYKGVIDAVKGSKKESKQESNIDPIKELKESIEVDLFLTKYSEFDESDVKLFQKFREPGQKLSQVLENPVVKAYVDKKLSESAHNKSIPKFSGRSSVTSSETSESKQFKTQLLNALPKATRALIEKQKNA